MSLDLFKSYEQFKTTSCEKQNTWKHHCNLHPRDEDEDVEEWGGRWRECDAYTPRIKKKNHINYLIM